MIRRLLIALTAAVALSGCAIERLPDAIDEPSEQCLAANIALGAAQILVEDDPANPVWSQRFAKAEKLVDLFCTTPTAET